MTGAAAADGIEVTLQLAAGRVAEVAITTRPPSGIDRYAKGRPADEVAKALPRIFGLCAMAQGAAVIAATAAARGTALAPDQLAACASAVAAERVLELLRGTVTMLAGPDLGGTAPALRALGAAAHSFDAAALPDRAASDAAIDAIEQNLVALGLSAHCFDGADKCQRWAASDAPLPRLLQPLLAGDASSGALVLDALSAADDAVIADRLGQGGAAFAARPHLDGRVPETGALARTRSHPLLSCRDATLAARLLARLIEARQTPALLRGLAAGVADPAELIAAMPLAPGIGFAAVECARGRLHHWIALSADGRIARLEILAPTEWNFHPQGPLARALHGAAARTDAERRSIEQLIAAFDPCVGLAVHYAELTDA
ncbi:nickel-dependent hydrogenase large subunit [Rhodopseudomonas palustris]|uniref:Putative hydrogenase expression/formation protein HupK n=1 Tax=Rhodopseudomonas palustris (strain BisB18) TaxID=316056 RepID=Q20ZY8_RHOPB